MLLRTNITGFTGHIFKSLGDHVINTNRIVRYSDIDGSSSNILYIDNRTDRRSKPTPAICDSTVSEIETALDAVLSTNTMVISIFPGDDITATPVDKYINYSDFIYASAYNRNSSYSIVAIQEGFHIKRYIIDDSLDDIIDNLSTGIQIVSAEIGSVQDNYIRLTFSEQLTIGVDGYEDEFLVSINGGDPIGNGGGASGNPITIYLDESASPGDIVTVSYQGTHWGSATKSLVYFTNFPVTNNT